MAIRGTFSADFSSFMEAVQKAEISLTSMQAGGAKVEAQINKVANSLEGGKIVQQATIAAAAIEQIGGISKLTETELARVGATATEAAAKLRAMGVDVPPGIQKIADATKEVATSGAGFTDWLGKANNLLAVFGVGLTASAAVNFGKSLIYDAGALVDMSTKTGNSIEQLQRYAFVGKQAQVQTEDLAQANFKLGVALEGGDKSVVQAVGRLGLEYDKLRAMNPDEQFNATIAVLERMTDTQERNRIGVELFGKSWATVAPAVAHGYTEMAAQAKVSSTDQIKAIDDMSDAWDRWYARQKTSLTSGLGNMILLKEAVAKLGDGYATFLLQTDPSIKTTDDLSAALIRAAGAHDVVLPKVQTFIGLTKEQQTAADQLAEAMVELNSAGKGWQGTLDTIDGEVVEAAKYYLDAGVSQRALATAYGLTAVQVKSVETAMNDAQEAQKQWDAIEKTSHDLFLRHFKEEEEAKKKATAAMNATVLAGFDSIQKAEAALHDYLLKESLDTASYQITKIWERADAQVAAFKGSEDEQKRYSAVVMHLASLEASAIVYEADNAMTTVANRSLLIVNDALTAMAAATNRVIPAGYGTSRYDAKGNDTWGVQNPGAPINFGMIPGRVSGGSVASNTPYVVGERGPELFIPSGSGAILPNGMGGGVTVTNHITITGSVLSNKRELADAIGAVMMDRLRSSGMRFQTGV